MKIRIGSNIDPRRFRLIVAFSALSKRLRSRVTLALMVSCFAVSFSAAAELTVFAAASLADSLEALSPLYAKASGNTVRFNFGASGTLARQIKEGTPADVFLSADELRLDQLDREGLLLPGTRRTLLANTLVLVVTADNTTIATLDDLLLPAVRHLAIGEPATVPAGTYAKTYLTGLNRWAPLQTKAVFLENVRAVLATVEAGNADAGFVYKTDALRSKKTRIALEIPQSEGPPIAYPAAVVKTAKSADAAQGFILWLAAPEAQSVFAKHGFLPPR